MSHIKVCPTWAKSVHLYALSEISHYNFFGKTGTLASRTEFCGTLGQGCLKPIKPGQSQENPYQLGSYPRTDVHMCVCVCVCVCLWSVIMFLRYVVLFFYHFLRLLLQLSSRCIVLYCGRIPAANAAGCTAAEGLLYKPWSLVVPTWTARCPHQRT